MDRIDSKILAELAKDASLTSEQLGARIGLSPSAAHRRVRGLEQAGMILGYGARLSRQARGNPSTIYVQVTLADQRQGTMMAFEQALERTSQVSEAHLLSGESDYLIKVEIADDDSYERVHRDILSALPGVQRLVSQVTLRTVISKE